MLILNRSEVARILTMPEALAACREAYVAVAKGTAVVPQRHSIHVPEPEGDMLVMPGYMPRQGALGLKVVSVFPGNRDRGLDATVGAVILLDPETGVPAVLMDGSYLTAIRTGAGSGVATDLLALPEADTLAVLGTGGMAWHQVEAVCAVRPIRRVLVWSRTRERAYGFAAEVQAKLPGCAVEAVATAEEAVSQALVICGATASTDPVIRGEWLRAGTHVNLIGSHHPHCREIDSAGVERAAVRAGDLAAAALHAGDLAIPVAEGRIDPASITSIGLILAGEAPGRSDPSQVTLFKSVGLAAQDLAAGSRVLARARELGLGLEVSLQF